MEDSAETEGSKAPPGEADRPVLPPSVRDPTAMHARLPTADPPGEPTADPPSAPAAPEPKSSTRLGLNALNFFLAATQTGFGPFIPVF
ncbi:MAG: hypothetical protein ACREFY_09915, partial [Acetobacteraceae bacterium]